YFVCVSVRLFAIKLTGPLVPYTPLFRSGLAARASWPSFPCRKSSQKWPTRPSRPRSTRNGPSLRHHVAVTRELAAWLHPALTPLRFPTGVDRQAIARRAPAGDDHAPGNRLRALASLRHQRGSADFCRFAIPPPPHP